MQGRLLRGPTKYYVVALVVALVAVALFVVVRVNDKPATATDTSTPGAISPLQKALDGIRDDGTWSKETALAVFAAAFGPLPDVPVPPVDESYHSGSLAIRMVSAKWSELTDAQKQAIRDYIGPPAPDILPAAFHGAALDTYLDLAQQAATDITAHLGRPLGMPIAVLHSPVEHGTDWAWASGQWHGGPLPDSCLVSIPPSTEKDASRGPYMRWILLHEVFHCFQHSLMDAKTANNVPPWVSDGEANWVAEAITGGAGEPPPVAAQWDSYITVPGKKLYARAYDAMGFFAQLAQVGIDPWTVLDATVMASAKGSDAAFEASGANTPTFLDRWGSSWYRDGRSNAAWAMSSGYGIPGLSHYATPGQIHLIDGGSASISATPLTATISNLNTTAFITRVEVLSGTGRVGERRAGGLDKVVRSSTLDLCTTVDGNCTCPEGTIATSSAPQVAPQDLRLAAMGEEHTTSVMNVRGISRSEWCSPKSACPSNCGGSNGDPHLLTVDGVRYDLQSAGEYVLLRSADGATEVQARQERPSEGENATIDTAIAVRVNGHRVGFYVREAGAPEVRVDGATVDPGGVGSADLGTGASLTAYQRGYQLDLADGTKVWVVSVGRWGINLLVQPSADLRASGVGLIARIPEGGGLQLPALPDGTRLPIPINRHERYHDLYEVFAPAWRVTPTTSLFDYESGQTTDSFTVPGFPTEAVPETIADLPQETLIIAQATCSGLSDPDLVDQCAYDVAVTGLDEYATLYRVTDALQAEGPASLDLPLPPPPSGGTGGAPTGAIVVEDHITEIGGHVVAPDGTLYVSVREQDASTGDSTAAVLAVDATTGKVNGRAAGADIGVLAWAAGSLWAGEFSRRDPNDCEVSRLDPVTLTVQATVPTVCSGNTAFAAVGDAIWFSDVTGADGSGAGGHLRRIDPATNKVDPSPSGNLVMPYVSGTFALGREGSFFTSTSDGLIFGDHSRGLFRFTDDGTFEPIGQPGTGGEWYPIGRGVWTQTESSFFGPAEGVASFFTGGSAPDAQVGINGMLVGADARSVYAGAVIQDLAQPQELWRYPTDRSAPVRIVSSGVTTDASGAQQSLSFQDPVVPLIVTDTRVIKLWLVPSPTTGGQRALVLQSAPLP